MIKDVLVPEKVGNYYIFPKRVVGFDIEKTNVTATKVHLKGHSVAIEQFLDEKLEVGNQLTHDQKVVKVIKNIVGSMGKFDEIYTAIPSSQVIFKSLKFPFLSYNKIKMVLRYEVEPLLPFSLEDAVIDFIITKQFPEEKSSEIMVAAVQKIYVEQQVKLFEEAGVSPKKVSVDLLSLYSLYKKIPQYANLKSGVALVDVGFSDTRIAYIHDGRLAFVRTLPKGVFSYAKALSGRYSISQSEAVSQLMRFGLTKEDDAQYKEAIEKVLGAFWSEVAFTLQSFTAQIGDAVDISKILLLGQGSHIKGIDSFVKGFLHIDSQLFQVEGLTDEKNVSIKNSLTVPRSNIISLAIALPSPIMDKFNLYQVGVSKADMSLLNKQLITAIVFVCVIFLLLFLHSFIQIKKLDNEIAQSQKEVISRLKERFNVPKEEDTVEDVVDFAKREVKKEENVWGVFSGKDRVSFLKYLLVLTDVVDKEALGLQIKSLIISDADKQIVLDAKVKGFPELKKLVKDLRSHSQLFSYVQSPDKTEFSMKITLKK